MAKKKTPGARLGGGVSDRTKNNPASGKGIGNPGARFAIPMKKAEPVEKTSYPVKKRAGTVKPGSGAGKKRKG